MYMHIILDYFSLGLVKVILSISFYFLLLWQSFFFLAHYFLLDFLMYASPGEKKILLWTHLGNFFQFLVNS